MSEGVLDLPCPIYPTQTLPYRPPRHPPRQPSGRPFFCIFFNPSFSSQNGCFLASPGTPKSTQNRLLCQKLAPQADFLVIFWPLLLLPCFFDVWGPIFDDCSIIFSMYFSMSVSVFSKPPNLQIYWQGQYFQLFSGFLFFAFFLKNDQKKQPKLWPRKTIEK